MNIFVKYKACDRKSLIVLEKDNDNCADADNNEDNYLSADGDN